MKAKVADLAIERLRRKPGGYTIEILDYIENDKRMFGICMPPALDERQVARDLRLVIKVLEDEL